MKTRSLPIWVSALATFSSWTSIHAANNISSPANPQSFDRRLARDGEELPAWLTERRIIGQNNLEPLLASQDTESISPTLSVARVETADGEGFCTASRIGINVFLTNFHCFEFVDCDNLQFHLGFEKNIPENQQQVFTCQEVLGKNERFDYALYRAALSPTIPSSEVSESLWDEPLPRTHTATLMEYPVATLWAGPLELNQTLLLASHPRSRLKEVDRSPDCKLLTIVPEEFLGRETITHTCDTEGGSSGAPVFDRKSGRIVALHWGGTDDHNMAVPLSLIVDDWKKTLSNDVLAELQIQE